MYGFPHACAKWHTGVYETACMKSKKPILFAAWIISLIFNNSGIFSVFGFSKNKARLLAIVLPKKNICKKFHNESVKVPTSRNENTQNGNLWPSASGSNYPCSPLCGFSERAASRPLDRVWDGIRHLTRSHCDTAKNQHNYQNQDTHQNTYQNTDSHEIPHENSHSNQKPNPYPEYDANNDAYSNGSRTVCHRYTYCESCYDECHRNTHSQWNGDRERYRYRNMHPHTNAIPDSNCNIHSYGNANSDSNRDRNCNRNGDKHCDAAANPDSQ